MLNLYRYRVNTEVTDHRCRKIVRGTEKEQKGNRKRTEKEQKGTENNKKEQKKNRKGTEKSLTDAVFYMPSTQNQFSLVYGTQVEDDKKSRVLGCATPQKPAHCHNYD